jgi:uncharacterized membrane protein YoaK (UPF0700 family)
VDACLVTVLGAIAILARRPRYLLSQGFWLDEGWVADSVRAPLGQLRLLTSSTPIGWTLLLRLIPEVGPPERLRLLPLAFAVVGVVAAYLLARRLGRVQAVAAGLAVALAPSALHNHSLKQYSADVCVTLVLLWLAARLQAGWSRGRLVALCLACVSGALVSHVTLFASVAVLGALAVLTLAERRWDRLGWIVLAAAGVALIQAAAYLLFAAAGDNQAMQQAWAGRFIPLDSGLGPAAAFAARRSAEALARVGFGVWPLAAALAAAGLVTFWRARLRVVPIAVGLLAAELLVAGAAHRYPFLEERTSVFFTTLLTVCGAVAVGAVAAWSVRRPLTIPLGIAMVVAAAGLLMPAARAGALHPLPTSTVRQQVAHVLAHRHPGDVVVVGWAASYEFGYYWPDRPTFVPTTSGSTILFEVTYPERRELILVTPWRSAVAINRALQEAASRSTSGRVWVVLAEAGDQDPSWGTAMRRVGLVVRRERPRLLQVGTG